MPLITWSDNLAVGNATIDNQHQKLVGMVNDLHDAMIKRQGRQMLASLLVKLANYAGTHFACEEKLMQQAGYQGYEQHKAIHEQFNTRVAALKARFEGGESSVTIDAMNFLRDWLQNHILQTDKKYAPSLLAAGIN